MTDEHALLAAIAADPEDDTARLAYADFVEENGDPDRAAFVRVQVELERPQVDPLTRLQLVRENRRFHNSHVPFWRAALPELPGIEWGHFKRGLVEEVQAHDESAIVRNAAEIFAQPAIHIIRLANLRLQMVEEFAALPELRRVRSLRLIGSNAGRLALQALFASPHLEGMRVLDLHGCSAEDEGVEDLTRLYWHNLAELWLGYNHIWNYGALTLALTPNFPRLRLLDLHGNEITDPTVHIALTRRFGSGVKL